MNPQRVTLLSMLSTVRSRMVSPVWLALLALWTAPGLGLGQSAQDASPSRSRYEYGAFSRQIDDIAEPTSVAIGPDDLIYVMESGRDTVRVLNPQGEAVRTWGGTGGEPGRFVRPEGIAVAADGAVYVADTGNHRIQVFGPTGSFLREWGGYGREAGRFNRPRGVAVQGDRVCVADVLNDRVQLFDLHGAALKSIGRYGYGDGEFIRPLDVCFDDEGRLYVADSENNRIQKFDREGQFIAAWGAWGSMPGLLATPTGVTVRGDVLYVSDFRNHRVQAFTLEGEALYEWGIHALRPREGEGRIHYPSDLAIAPSGDFAVVCESFENRCQLFARTLKETPPDALQDRWWERGIMQHFGRRFDTAADLLPITEPDSHAISLYRFTDSVPVMVTTIGGAGRRPGEFSDPGDVLLDWPKKRLWVVDSGNRRLQVFGLRHSPGDELKMDPTLARFVRSYDLAALGENVKSPLRQWVIDPAAIELSPRRELFILDARNNALFVFDEEMNFVRAVGGYGEEPAKLRNPSDLAFGPDGDVLYVVDSDNRRVQAFDPDGRLLFEFGRTGEGELSYPFGVAVDRDGAVYVTDHEADQVVKFDPRGEFIERWGRQGLLGGEFYKPAGIEVDEQGRIIVLDYGNHRGQMLSRSGEFDRAFGSRVFVQAAKGIRR